MSGENAAREESFGENRPPGYLQQYAGYQQYAQAAEDEYQMPSFQPQQQTPSQTHYHQPDQAAAISSGGPGYPGGYHQQQQEWQRQSFAGQQQQNPKALDPASQPDYNNNNNAGYLNFQQNFQTGERQFQQVYSSTRSDAGFQSQDIYYDYEQADGNGNFLMSTEAIQQQQTYDGECLQLQQQHQQHQQCQYEHQQHLASGKVNYVADHQDSASSSPAGPRGSSRASRRGRPRKKGPKSKSKVNGKLWEFIRDLLLSERTNPSFIRWERREDGVFKFVQSDKVAKMWGERKQNPKMTYEKLSRAMRYYYKSKVLLPVFGRRLVYKFGPNATGWMASAD